MPQVNLARSIAIAMIICTLGDHSVINLDAQFLDNVIFITPSTEWRDFCE